MKKIALQQIIIPLVVLSIILFIYFGPLPRVIYEHVIISLLIIGANYIEFKGKPFSALGFSREKFNAKNLLVHAPLTALGLFGCFLLIVPALEMLTGVPYDMSSLAALEGDLTTSAIWLLVVWVTGAFGEEIIFRGYFMRQFIKFFGDSKVSLAICFLIFSAFFGYMHWHQGITGQIIAGTIGVLFCGIFYKRRYDLWFLIMVHGFFNTLGILCAYFGLTWH